MPNTVEFIKIYNNHTTAPSLYAQFEIKIKVEQHIDGTFEAFFLTSKKEWESIKDTDTLAEMIAFFQKRWFNEAKIRTEEEKLFLQEMYAEMEAFFSKSVEAVLAEVAQENEVEIIEAFEDIKTYSPNTLNEKTSKITRFLYIDKKGKARFAHLQANKTLVRSDFDRHDSDFDFLLDGDGYSKPIASFLAMIDGVLQIPKIDAQTLYQIHNSLEYIQDRLYADFYRETTAKILIYFFQEIYMKHNLSEQLFNMLFGSQIENTIIGFQILYGFMNEK